MGGTTRRDVVVGVDQSPEALAAARYALWQAEKRGLDLVVLHTYSIPAMEAPLSDAYFACLREAAQSVVDKVVVEIAPPEARDRLLTIVIGRGQRRRLDAEGVGGADLIVHQRNERGDDQRRARPRQRRHLIAERLARPGGHDCQRVRAAHHPLHHLGLHASKALEAKRVAKD